MPTPSKPSAEWSAPRDNVRDDDPYHAWASIRTNDAPSEKDLCPVILKLKLAANTYEALKNSLVQFALRYVVAEDRFTDAVLSLVPDAVDTIDIDDETSGPFRLSDYDKQHLIESLERVLEIKDQKEKLTQGTDYARIFLGYAGEGQLFPRANFIGLWKNKVFEIRYSGRPVTDQAPDRSINLRFGFTDTIPDVDLAVIDDSIAFLNQEFFYSDTSADQEIAKTRFEAIWFQDRPVLGRYLPEGSNSLYNGVRVYADGIEEHLRTYSGASESEMYQKPIADGDADLALGAYFHPVDFTLSGHQALAFPISHGTHVTSTALRSYLRECASGVPEGCETHDKALTLHGVTLPTHVTQDTSGSRLASYLIAGLRQVMLWNDAYARNEEEPPAGESGTHETPPLVINVSYGFPAGPKDGSSQLTSVVAEMLNSRNERGRKTALVVPMGNAYDERGVARGTVSQGKSLSFLWVLEPDDFTSSFLEIFARSQNGGDAQFDISFTPPTDDIASLLGTCNGRQTRKSQVLERNGSPLASWSDWGVEKCSSWDLRGFLAMAPTAEYGKGQSVVPAGRWLVTLSTRSEDEIDISVFVQRDDAPGTYPTIARQSYLDHPNARRSWDDLRANSSEPRYETEKPGGKFSEVHPDGPITRAGSDNLLASVASPYVFVAAAGMGLDGDKLDQEPLGPAPYASEGFAPNSPDFTGLTDRNHSFPGVYASGTYSGTEARMNGSSVAAPILAGVIAAHANDVITGNKADLAKVLGHDSAPIPPDARFGLVRRHSNFGETKG